MAPRRAGTVRIIAGRWRGRTLALAAGAPVRPTPDRARETLFNWLRPAIEGAACLDLFAGSGALGFEALSRGAARATLVDANAGVCARIRRHAEEFGADGLEVIHCDAMSFLARPEEFTAAGPYDVVFLDPPFSDNLLEQTCERLRERHKLIRPDALVYVESAAGTFAPPQTWHSVHQARAGAVEYFLLVKGV